MGVLDNLDVPEFRYTDRHVREDASLGEFARAYLATYGGDFDPLVDAQRELRDTGTLSTRTTRVTLNCMRYDRHMTDQMPTPKSPNVNPFLNVEEKPFCVRTDSHERHWSNADGWQECNGVPFPINRRAFSTNVRVRAKFAAARTSNIYHRTVGRGWVEWYPPRHDTGPAEFQDFVVKLRCKYPSTLRKPLLFVEEPTQLLSAIGNLPGYRTRCQNGCFSDE